MGKNKGKKSNKETAAAKHGTNEKKRIFPRKPAYIIAIILMALAAIAFFVMMILADILPSDLTIILALIVTALLLLTCVLFASRSRWKRIVGILLALVFIVVISTVTSFMASTYNTLNEISATRTNATGPVARSVNVTEDAFNIYITGIDQWECEKGLDLERSDVNMIVTVDPKTRKILLTSIPRDSYVKLHTAQLMDKLTHTGVYGVDETLSTVEDWLGIKINYYVKMNFSATRDIIDAMGGIRVYSPATFDSSLKEEYHYEKGWNLMGGNRALYFARERKAFEGQDSVRVENQQRVVEAMIDRMTSSTTLLTHYGDIMNAAGDNLTTNLSADDMTELVKMQITNPVKWDVETQKIEGEYDMDYVASLTQSQKFYIYRPDAVSVKECVDNIERVLNPKVSEIEEAEKNNSKSFVVNYIKHLVDSYTKIRDKDKED